MKGRTRQEDRHTGTEDPPESLSCARNPEPENTDALGLQMPHARHKRSSRLGYCTAQQARGGRKAPALPHKCWGDPSAPWTAATYPQGRGQKRSCPQRCAGGCTGMGAPERWETARGSRRQRVQEAEGAAAEPTARNSPRQGTALGTHRRGTVTRPGTRPAYKQPTEERHCRVGAQHALRSPPGPREDGRPGCPALIHTGNTTGQIRHHMPAPRHCHHGAPIPNRTPTKSQAEAQ